MRSILRLPRHLSNRQPLPTSSHRAFSTTPLRPYSSPFGSGPSPPRLPKEEQERFEQLQKQSTGAFSTPRSSEPSPSTTTTTTTAQSSSSSSPQALRAQINQSPDSSPTSPSISIENGGKVAEGEELHPHMRRGAPPEFEGDVNPKTGEVGGPKNEPLRWGHGGDWSFNGRVTDF